MSVVDFGQPLAREAYEAMGVMPFQDFPPAKQAEINAACTRTRAPEKWLSVPLAVIRSRAHFEWYWRRGGLPHRTSFSQPFRRALYARDGGVCRYCERPVEFGEMHLDHILPLSRGGSDSPSNLATSCAACNLSKGAKTPEEWLS